MGVDLLNIFFDDKGAKPKTEVKAEAISQPSVQKPAETTYFPDSTPSVITYAPSNNTALNCEPHMTNVLKQYEQGFDALNLPGYDFFEFFKAVSLAGIDNPQVYDMAFMMGKSMEPSLTQDKLRSDGQFYLNKINDVYKTFSAEGEAKRAKVNQEKTNEGGSLQQDIEFKRTEIETLKKILLEKEQSLRELDAKYAPLLNEVDCKLLANNTAKDRMVGLITKVINNIK